MKTLPAFLIALFFAVPLLPAQGDEPVPVSGRFSGSLSIHTDNGDTLPVYINNEKAGVTPFRRERVPVGWYKVSYLDSAVRRTLLDEKEGEARSMPPEYVFLFKARDASSPLARKSLAAYAEQDVLVKNNEESEVIFTVGEMRSAMESAKKTHYGQFILGGTVLAGLTALLIMSVSK